MRRGCSALVRVKDLPAEVVKSPNTDDDCVFRFSKVLMQRYFILLIVFFLPVHAGAEDLAIARLFAARGVDGTVVIASLNTGQAFIHNDARAGQRFSPASTFKIMNTLIAVEEAAVGGKDDVFKWDGHVYNLETWNHDQTLASAFKVSCVWCYQALARLVGAEKYRHDLTQADYGVLADDFAVDTFWLDGALTVSALGQVRFLKQVVRRELPFHAHAYDTLRAIMRVAATPSYTLWAKTGWATRVTPQVGWYVGYVETAGDVWVFALNMTTRDTSDLPLRETLVREALQTKGIIE